MATAYYKEPPNQKYWRNIDQLSMLGSIVKFNVDALDLESSLKQVGVKQKFKLFLYDSILSDKVRQTNFVFLLLSDTIALCLPFQDQRRFKMINITGNL